MYRVAWFYYFAEWFGDGIAESRDWSEASSTSPRRNSKEKWGQRSRLIHDSPPLQKQRKE